jgi:hypothetical protein
MSKPERLKYLPLIRKKIANAKASKKTLPVALKKNEERAKELGVRI